MTRYALIAALAFALATSGYALWLSRSVSKLEASNASLTRSVAAFQMQADQAALARDVEKARADAQAERAAQLDASIEALTTGDIPDAPLDPRIIDLLSGGLRGD